MCGVIGLLIKDRELESELGAMLVPMVAALSDRGPDSAGIGLYSNDDPTLPGSDPSPGPDRLRISLGSDVAVPWATLASRLESDKVTVRAFRGGAVVTAPEGDA